MRHDPEAGSRRRSQATGARFRARVEGLPRPRWPKAAYVVKKGDTLYSIALEHGGDYREIAAWNKLNDPTKIQVGQVLRVTPPEESRVQVGRAKLPERGEARPLELPPPQGQGRKPPAAVEKAPPPRRRLARRRSSSGRRAARSSPASPSRAARASTSTASSATP
jgi:lipoprotein NlpD